MEEYYTDYPTIKIYGGNPNYECAECGVSVPEINGRLDGHLDSCSWRREKEQTLAIRNATDFQYKEKYSDEDLLELINTDMFNYLREPSVVITDLVKIIKVLDARLTAVEASRTRFG